nr:hypothetical protein [Chlamydiota bacterium]
MRLPFTNFYEKLKTSLWFVPIMMTMMGPILARLFFDLDLYLSDKKDFFPWMWTGSSEAATQLFTTLAASLVTMSSLLFSITMLVLTVVSQQYGSHILRVFKRNLFIKCVLGWFISAFVYSLFLIVFLSTENDPHFHPQFSIVFGILIMVLSFVIFIVFIHHMTNLIQSDHIIAAVTNGLRKKIEELEEYVEKPKEASKKVLKEFDEEKGIFLESSGYIQSIDIPYLVTLGTQYETAFFLPLRAGHYVARGVPVVFMPEPTDDETLVSEVRKCFILGYERLPKDDFEYHLEQLMEICLKALSPGVNNTYVAMTVIDHLGDAFVMLAIRRFPQECYQDEEGELRVISKRFTYDSFVSAAINPIKQNARSDPQVLIRLLDMLERVLSVTDDVEKRQVLMEHAGFIYRAGENGI